MSILVYRPINTTIKKLFSITILVAACAALIERINTRHGLHILELAEAIGLGSRKYNLVAF